MTDNLDRLTVHLAELDGVARGLTDAIAAARRSGVLEPEPHLDLHAWHAATDLMHDDVPFAALIAAALYRADATNAALIRACWPTLSATAQARYDAPGGRLAEEAADADAERAAPPPTFICWEDTR